MGTSCNLVIYKCVLSLCVYFKTKEKLLQTLQIIFSKFTLCFVIYIEINTISNHSKSSQRTSYVVYPVSKSMVILLVVFQTIWLCHGEVFS